MGFIDGSDDPGAGHSARSSVAMCWREQRNEAAQLGMQPTAARAMMSAAAADARR
jgi:hypothetical protein